MFLKSEFPSFFLFNSPDSAAWDHPASATPPGVCEVVSVPASDELPYFFEMKAGQRLVMSLSASAEIDVVLCKESAYDDWIDSGMRSEHPSNAILMSRLSQRHSFEYRAPQNGNFLVVLINLSDAP